MPIKRYNGTDWEVVAGAGVQGATGASGNTTVNSKGDLLTFDTAAARLPVGANGETLVADSSTSTGLSYQANWAAGKNKIINGDFRINQRNLTTNTTNNVFGFDRWLMLYSGGTVTWSAQTFTPGAAPVAGYEGTNFFRSVTSGQSGVGDYTWAGGQRIEDVRTFAGQTITISFWAKAATGTPKVGISLEQIFGSGGSSSVIIKPGDVTISTSWARYSVTVAIPSISGKTIGTSSSLVLELWASAGSNYTAYTGIGVQNNTIDIWGVQVEAGSVATAFQTATGNLASELAACQRYYVRYTVGSNGFGPINSYGVGYSTTAIQAVISVPVTMRKVIDAIDTSAISFQDVATGTNYSGATATLNQASDKSAQLLFTGLSGITSYRQYTIYGNGNSAAYLGFSAEL